MLSYETPQAAIGVLNPEIRESRNSRGDAEVLKKIGIRLKAMWLRWNSLQEYVAGVVGVSVPTYRKIEQGDGTVEFRHVARALGALGLTQALGDVIPATEPELRLKDLLRPERKNASKPRRKPFIISEK